MREIATNGNRIEIAMAEAWTKNSFALEIPRA